MPFGKANSSKHFCEWTDLWFSSFLRQFRAAFPFLVVLGSYVDDGFGGALTQAKAQMMIDWMHKAGKATGTSFNLPKTCGPATRLVILGFLYCSGSRFCRLGDDKRTKYVSRIDHITSSTSTTSKDIERLVGNLGYAAWVEPYGRPLLTFIAHHITTDNPHLPVSLSSLSRIALTIWRAILLRNRGLPYKYILNSLPQVRTPVFVDAASSVGLGGVHGCEYFQFTHDDLRPYVIQCPGWEYYPRVIIAWTELLAVFVALYLFGSRYPERLIVLYSDNSCVVAWLGPRRSPCPTVCALVAAIERIKFEYSLKLSVRYIPSKENRTADLLSRNSIPLWLERRGTRLNPKLDTMIRLIHRDYLTTSWKAAIANSHTHG